MKMRAGIARDRIKGDNPARIRENDYATSDEKSARIGLGEGLHYA